MSEIVLKIDDVSKQYRLGLVGTGTISHDLNRWWRRIRGKEDPYLKISTVNDRAKEGGDYVWALKDINLEIKKGEIIGVIGKNGAGKSTLLKLLSQVTGPTTGSIKVKGRIAALLEVGTGFHPELTGRENIYLNGAILGMDKKEIAAKIDEIIDFSGIAKYVDTPVKRYSSGMMVRLGFSVAAHLEPEILIVDEVLAVGDSEFQKKCIAKMKDVAGEGRTIIFVSHNMIAINNLCEKALLMENGSIVSSGEVNSIIDLYLHGEKDENFSFGTIERGRKRYQYHKNKVYFSCILLVNQSGINVETLRFHETASLKIEIDSTEAINDVVLIAGFMNDDHDKITYSASNDQFNNKIINLNEGVNKFQFKLEQQLLPGDYYMYFSVLDKSGYPYDSLNYFGNVKVENFGLGEEKYFWGRPIGLVNTKSKME